MFNIYNVCKQNMKFKKKEIIDSPNHYPIQIHIEHFASIPDQIVGQLRKVSYWTMIALSNIGLQIDPVDWQTYNMPCKHLSYNPFQLTIDKLE